MLRIPINPYTNRRPDGRSKDVVVDVDDEGGLVLSIDVDPRELTSTYRRPPAELEELLERWAPDSGTSPADPNALLLIQEVRRLREELESRVESIDLHPEPGEARAIAAALIHYADEHERVFGRRF